MPNVLVRNIPQDLKDSLEQTARSERRSTNQTIIVAIEAYLASKGVLDPSEAS